jgi:hypothetical protein
MFLLLIALVGGIIVQKSDFFTEVAKPIVGALAGIVGFIIGKILSCRAAAMVRGARCRALSPYPVEDVRECPYPGEGMTEFQHATAGWGGYFVETAADFSKRPLHPEVHR